MDINVYVIVPDVEKRKKYISVIETIIQNQLLKPKVTGFHSAEQALEKIKTEKNFCDIIMMQATQENLEIANEIRLYDRRCVIIYPAGSMKYVLEAFKSMPRAYVVPNVELNNGQTMKLSDAILSAVKYINETRNDLILETKSKMLNFSLPEIDYIESQYRIIRIIKSNGVVEAATKKLDEIDALCLPGFYRCHKSYLVNVNNIDYIDKTDKTIYFLSGKSVPASKSLFTDFLNNYTNYVEGVKNGNV